MEGYYLKRKVSWTNEGFHWESDPKHAKTVAEAYEKLAASRQISPASKNVGKDVPTALDVLDQQRKRKFQSAAPTVLYLAADRPDIQFSTSWIMRGMQTPEELQELGLKGLAAYLTTHPQLVWHFLYAKMSTELIVVCDSDWAGDQVSRRSRGGGFELLGGMCIDS